MKLMKCLVIFFVCFLWAGLALAGHYRDSSREYSGNYVVTGHPHSLYLSAKEQEREEAKKKKKIIKYGVLGLLGAAYIGSKFVQDDSDPR